MKDVSALARQHLAAARAKFPPYNYSPMFRRALGQCGYGLHHLQGEEVVAIVNHSQTREEFMGVVVTTFTVLARFGDERVRVDFDDLRRAELYEGWIQTVIKMYTDDDEIELPILRDVQPVADFLTAVAGYRPVKRNTDVVLAPTPDDPGCVEAFIASLGDDDSPEFATWAGAARRRLEADEDAGAIRDTIARLHLLRLQMSRGRGMHDGHFLSPLRRPDLARITSELLPQPKEEPAELLPDPTKVKEQMQAALLEKAVGAAVQKTLGLKVDLDDIIGDDTVEGRRFELVDGPPTTLAVGAPGEAESTWGMLKSLARRVIGEGDGPGSYGAFDLQGRTGRRWKELANLEPNPAFELLEELQLHEIEVLTAPPAPKPS
jgi:hypothetical protein